MVALMPYASSNRLIGELTFLEISNRLSKRSILFFSIGSLEKHGPHLPLNTDIVLAEGLTERIILRWGEGFDLWQLPTISISLAGEHEWRPGPMSLSIPGMRTLLR